MNDRRYRFVRDPHAHPHRGRWRGLVSAPPSPRLPELIDMLGFGMFVGAILIAGFALGFAYSMIVP